jgi:hypothetical protein
LNVVESVFKKFVGDLIDLSEEEELELWQKL